MDLTKYRQMLIGNEQERAVSPVIGVILMVAITVILAAVIAAFVLDMGDLSDSAPSATYDWDEEKDASGVSTSVTLSHSGGDDIEVDNVVVSIDGTSEDLATVDSSHSSGDKISAGDTIDLTEDATGSLSSGNYEAGDTIEIIWESDGTSSKLTEFETSN